MGMLFGVIHTTTLSENLLSAIVTHYKSTFQLLHSNIDEEIELSLLINNQIHSHNTRTNYQMSILRMNRSKTRVRLRNRVVVLILPCVAGVQTCCINCAVCGRHADFVALIL